MVKAIISGKGVPMKIEGDVLIGTAFRYDELGRSESFVVGDVIHRAIPAMMAGLAVSILSSYFEGEALYDACAEFHELFIAMTEGTVGEDTHE